LLDIQSVKQRYGIIGNSPQLKRAIEIALQVAPTDLTVLITGESGVGKENFPKIIHQNSARKHASYVAVNCGAIPEGTIDSELFGHEKGSFTGATDARKGYFEQVGGGTIFLDEVAELPLGTQVKLLRVLESGEYLRVGSSKVQTVDVRVIAATNVNMTEAVSRGKFREDLYYRLNTVPISIPPLRERKDDILLLFKKFAIDFSERYHMPAVELNESGKAMLLKYSFPGNVRQLKNIVEQISIIEQERVINSTILANYIPENEINTLPVLKSSHHSLSGDMTFERELIFKFLAEMQKDITELKRQFADLTHGQPPLRSDKNTFLFDPTSATVLPSKSYKQEHIEEAEYLNHDADLEDITDFDEDFDEDFDKNTSAEDIFSIQEKEKELILKSIRKNNGKRKKAAQDLGISERTLYRKLKRYGLEDL
jgi:transcriptional regulator with PAS, ATPase and Fis domain